MFGPHRGRWIYNVVKIAEGELLEGSERPMYPEKILKVEIIELPKGDAWQKMPEKTTDSERFAEAPSKKKASKEERRESSAKLRAGMMATTTLAEVAVRPRRPSSSALIDAEDIPDPKQGQTATAPRTKGREATTTAPSRRYQQSEGKSPISTKSPSPTHHRKPPSTTRRPNFPERPRVPIRSPTPRRATFDIKSKTSALQAEIATLKPPCAATSTPQRFIKAQKVSFRVADPSDKYTGASDRDQAKQAPRMTPTAQMLSAFKARL